MDENIKTKNAQITNVSLNMRKNGILSLDLTLSSDGWGVTFGGYILGKKYVETKQFKGTQKGIEYIMRVMDTVGVDSFEELKGKYVRIVDNGWEKVDTIGNIIEDKWLNIREFFCD